MDLEKMLTLLNQQIAYARTHSRFYAKLPEAPLTDLRQLSALPMVTAEDISRRGMEMLCCSPARVRRMVTLATSGTTGPNKRLAFSDGDLERTVDFFHHGMNALCGKGSIVAIFMPGNHPDGLCRLLAEGLRRFGAVPHIYGPVTDPEDAARFCRRANVQVMVGIPVQMRRLALAYPDLRPETVLLSSDYLSPPLAETIARCWSCQVYNHYGLTESGLGCAVETPRRAGMELRPDVLLETLPDSELVLTTLCREAMPLIRFRTGDLGRLLPDGSLDAVFGRKAELEKPVPIYRLDELLFGLDEVLDFSAWFGQGVLKVALLGDASRAVQVLREAFPAYKVQVETVPALERRSGAKRGAGSLQQVILPPRTPL